MKNSGTKDGIILLLFSACTLLGSCYMGARDDVERMQQFNNRIFNMLPEYKQRQLREEWETRMDLLDPGAHSGPRPR